MKLYTAFITAAVAVFALSTTVSTAASTSIEPAQISAAKTAADHEAIAKAYEDEAAELDRKVKMHEQLTDTYKSNGKLLGPAKHCESLTKDFKAAANESRLLAAEHHKMAQQAGK